MRQNVLPIYTCVHVCACVCVCTCVHVHVYFSFRNVIFFS